MYMAPWAKLNILSILNRKAKPSDVNIYIDDSINELIIVVTISSIEHLYLFIISNSPAFTIFYQTYRK
jgi:hypothetical protein